ncbi:hypothetical protein LCGC14_1145740 [marine sediment metagenome]|uniref:Restriction endonuclease type IV Mrr domain-containing protein n=1 Tax=marine sediment metagenome TaxID=412755 RepID=A0A0F9LWW5_9ZZZZ
MSFVEKNLTDLAKYVFSEKYQFIEGPHKFKGNSGKSWTFDAIVKTKSNTFGLFIRDWKREISITQLRQLHKACIDTNIQGGIMVCNITTDFSREYSTQFGIQLLSRGHLISTLKRRQFQNDF